MAWQYLVECCGSSELASVLDRAGRAGWELVAVTEFTADDGYTTLYNLFFKKEGYG